MDFAVCLRGGLVKTGVSSLIKSFGVHDSKESNTFVHSEQLKVRGQMSQHLWGIDGYCILDETLKAVISIKRWQVEVVNCQQDW